MNNVFVLLGFILAALFFLAAAFGLDLRRVNLVALGLFSWVVAELTLRLGA